MDKNLDLSQFHQYLTGLNYFNDLSQSSYHPNLIEADQPKKQLENELELYEPVPIRFSSPKNYISLWKKLFYEQTKAQIIKGKFDESTQPEQLEFIDFSVIGKFKLLNFRKTQTIKNNYPSSQLVVLSPKIALKDAKDGKYPHLIGITEANQHFQVRVVLEMNNFSTEDFELINSSKKWYCQVLTSITTFERIFRALNQFEKICPMLQQLLLRPDLHNKQLQKKFFIPKLLNEVLKNNFNQSQYKSIQQSLKQQGVTLIQGPPGTGKTKTVLGTLSVLLGSQIKEQQEEDIILQLSWRKSSQRIIQRKKNQFWMNAKFYDWRDQPYLQDIETNLNITKTYLKSDITDNKIILKNHSETVQIPGKVLVCGPSNASVDQIIRKLINEQIFDKQGKKYLPKFVRIGDGYDSSLAQYSLEQLASKECKKKTQSDISNQRVKILKQFKLVFGTLSACGHQAISSCGIDFDTVIIDQAGQSIQIQNLIPLMYNCKRLILIGDPNQLPATVFSNLTLQYKYDQSLFERMMKCNYPVNILKIQYRMHPEISHVIGKNFYGDQLTNSKDKDIIKKSNDLPSSFMMLHLDNSYQEKHKRSYCNPIQAKFINKLSQFLQKYSNDIGIVSPYSQQVSLLQQACVSKNLQIKTIDSFQGRQKEIIILSSVRSRYFGKKHFLNRKKTIGFVADMRRVNVSLSRAKNTCIVVGDLRRLAVNKTWKSIIKDAIDKDQVYDVKDINKDTLANIFKNKKKYLLKKLDVQQNQAE